MSSAAVLTALAAIFFAMYTRSISPSSHGNFYELYAIAAAVLGGCSLRGGEGSILGVVLGTVLLQVLQNLVNLLGIPSSLNFAVMGSVILIGVLADQQFRRPVRRQEIVGLTACSPQALCDVPDSLRIADDRKGVLTFWEGRRLQSSVLARRISRNGISGAKLPPRSNIPKSMAEGFSWS